MSGTTSQRVRLRQERDERLAIFIEQGRPVRAVAKLEGIEHDYAYKLLKQVARVRGLEYHPRRVAHPAGEPILGLTAASQTLRARLGDYLYRLEGSPATIARQVGITAKNQPVAQDRPFNHDWTLSQIERLAEASNQDFHTFMLGLLAPSSIPKAA